MNKNYQGYREKMRKTVQSKADGTPAFAENQEDKVSQKPRSEECWGRRNVPCWMLERGPGKRGWNAGSDT